jgi:allose kinase
MEDTRTILGMDIGGTNMRTAFIDTDYNVDNLKIDKTADLLFGNDIPDKLTGYIASLLKTKKTPPIAISIGLPSTVDRANRIVYSTPNIKGLDNIDIASHVEKVCTIPVFVIRDVCLLLLHDIHVNRLKKEGFILGFYVGTGFGNAISLNGEIVTGKHGVAAELGHIPVIGRTELCGCGNRGCIELYASGKRLAEIQNTYFKGMNIEEVLEKHTGHPVIMEFVENIAIGIASEITILDPEEVILGGGVIMRKGFPRQMLEKAIRKYTRKPYPANSLRFIYSKESNENGVIGAGIFGFQKYRDRE